MKRTESQDSFFTLFPRIVKNMFEVDQLYIFFMSIVTIIQSLIPALSLLIMQQIINLIQLGNHNIILIVQLLIFYVSVDLFSTVLTGFTTFYTTKFSLKFNLYIKKIIMVKASTLSLWHYENSATYDKIKLAERADGGTIIGQFSTFISMIGTSITALSYIAILLRFNYFVILIIIITPIVKYIIVNTINKKQFAIVKARTNQERKTWYYNFIVTNGTHFKELKIYHLFAFFIEKFESLTKAFNKQDIGIAKETLIKVTTISIFEQIITGGIFSFTIYCGFIGVILLGDVVTYTRAVISNQSCIQTILQNTSQMKKSNLYISQFYSFIDLENREALEAVNKIRMEDQIHSIQVENLSFKYDTGDYVLKHVNFTFRKGEAFAVVGKNGSGKTTLSKLLLGLYDNYEGNIYINGMELRSIDKESYMRKTASLFQDYIRYDATFRENIAYGNLDILNDDEKLKEISKLFKLTNIIDESNKNLDTQLGYWFDEGKQISIGEWQRLSIARTFSRNADVIVLDEPNSALDAISDYEISLLYQHLLQNKMGIIIAHKFNHFINQANCIVVLDKGELVESGTHMELMKREGIYFKLNQLQHID